MPINRTPGGDSDDAPVYTSDDPVRAARLTDASTGKWVLGPSTVTLSGLLNAIDGVFSQVSRISQAKSQSDTSKELV
jgi:hypothetical protein